MKTLALLVLLLALPGCPPASPAPSPTPPDASDASVGDTGALTTPCQAACDRMASLGCSQGRAPACVPSMAHADGSRLIRMHDGGALHCTDVAEARNFADLVMLGMSCAP